MESTSALLLLLAFVFTNEVQSSDFGVHHGPTPNYLSYSGHGQEGVRYHGPTAVPHVLHDGHIADTHEVAAAKAQHFSAVSKAKTHGHDYSDSHEGVRYHGPTAVPHVLHDGHIADTHEVAAAKAQHFSAVSKAKTHGHDYSDIHEGVRYHGPTAVPHVLHDGHIADTHEVAAAKAQHFSAVSKAKTHGHDYSDSHEGVRYHGPTAVPHVLHDGHIADTHEVAAAKAQHFSSVSKAKTYGHDYSGYHTAPYHGPLAKPVLLKSGYLADTQEVSDVKKTPSQGFTLHTPWFLQ